MTNFGGLGAGFAFLMLIGRITSTDDIRAPSTPGVCRLKSFKDSIFGSLDFTCSLDGIDSFFYSQVIEGGESALLRALTIVHENPQDYVALIFYASWCPFSEMFRPTFSIMASLFPTISHFAIEESAVRPSVLSKYGVHGFPTIFLINSTLRARYHGSRTIESMTNFYADVSGISRASAEGVPLDKIRSYHEKQSKRRDVESCPFSWARSPEKLLRQETYLAISATFVLLRVLYFFFPAICRCTQSAWRKHALSTRFMNLWEHPRVYLNRAVQSIGSLKEPCWKRSNLQEGAINAKAWASKSLASVSLGESSSSSRVMPVS